MSSLIYTLNSKNCTHHTDIVLLETIVTNEYVEYTINLSQYAGEQGYIAIRHFNCTNQFRLNVDDFWLIGNLGRRYWAINMALQIINNRCVEEKKREKRKKLHTLHTKL